MPLDIQIPYKGSDYLFQGISSGAAGLASGAESAIKKFRQIQDAGKAADYFMKAGGDDMYSQAGIHPEEWKTLGPRDKAAVVQGIMEQGTAKKLQAQLEDMHAQAMERQQAAAYKQTQGEAEQALPRVMQSILERRKTMPGPGPGPDVDPGGEMDPNAMMSGGSPNAPAPGGPMKPDELMQAISEMGATNPKVAAALINKFMPMMTGTEDGSPMSFSEDPKTGMRFAVKGKQVLPSGINPAMQKGLMALPVPDENGNVIAHAFTDAKGKTTFMKPDRSQLTAADRFKLRLGYDKLHVDLLNAKRFAGPEPESQEVYDKAIANNQSILDELKDNTPPKAGAAASILELPKDVKQLKKGQVYKTGKGPALWNGQAFEKQ